MRTSADRAAFQAAVRAAAIVVVVAWLFSDDVRAWVPVWVPIALLLAAEVEFVVRGRREAPRQRSARVPPGPEDADLGFGELVEDEHGVRLLPPPERPERRGRRLGWLIGTVVAAAIVALAAHSDRAATWTALSTETRTGTEARLTSEASRIAGRPVRVRCDDGYAFTGAGSDTILGNAGSNTLIGDNASDTLYGANGNDLLLGVDGDDIAYGVLDPSAFTEDGGPSIAERMGTGSDGKVWFKRADNSRVYKAKSRGNMSGWDAMRARLVGDDDGHAMLVVFSTCTDFIRTVPYLQHDPDRPEDVMTDAEDHEADCCRYACLSRPYVQVSEKPKPEDVSGYAVLHKSTEAGDWRTY